MVRKAKWWLWLILGTSVTVALLFASCAQTPASPTSGTTVSGKVTQQPAASAPAGTATAPTTPTSTTPPVTTTAGGPQYGGTFTWVIGATGPDKFDPVQYSSAQESAYIGLWAENLLIGDLSKGPRGTKEYAFNDLYWIPDPYVVGSLATSWEWATPLSVRFHLRQGVNFQDRPDVMAAREMTSADVVYSLTRLIAVKGTLGTRYQEFESAKAVDKYTVDVVFNQYQADWLWRSTARGTAIIPPEMEKAGIENWKNQVGTGPFMLYDYVTGSSLTYIRNPNYWGSTTIDGKQYKLPFVDKVIYSFITDASTQIAALRTGKTDLLAGVTWQNRASLAKTNPDLKQFKNLTAGLTTVIFMREDTAPFSDIRVRLAMNMAVDRKTIVDTFLGGESVPLSWPLSLAWGPSFFTPLEELPAQTQQAFTYDPAKAIDLLKQAGLPQGFKTDIVFPSAAATTGDLASMLAEQWGKIGVTVELKPMEATAFTGLVYAKKQTGLMLTGQSNSSPISVLRGVGEPNNIQNFSIFNHADWYKDFLTAIGTSDVAKQTAMMKKLNADYINYLDLVQLPTGYAYLYTQPWINNYYGETNVASYNLGLIFGSLWIDQKMKSQAK